MTVGFCSALYRVSGEGALTGASTAAGGVVGGVILLLTPTAAGYYLRLAASRTPEGVFLVLAGVLITCYLVALGLLLGVGVSVRVQRGGLLTEAG